MIMAGKILFCNFSKTFSESWLKNKTGFDSAAILKMLKEFYSLSVNTPQEAWNSYDKLNRAIQESLIL
ncbi:MAG: hypothetical protein GXZ07_09105 [Firmicutes bacterium]|nr:hypothetical protein [Bacillota bacterium]